MTTLELGAVQPNASKEISRAAKRRYELQERLPRLLYGIEDASVILGVSRASGYRLIAQGGLPTVTVMGRKMVAWSVLENYVAGLQARTATAGRS